MLMRLIGEHIEFETDLDPDLGIIKADRSQIEQVIMNLAVNARDAIQESGKVTLDRKSTRLNSSHTVISYAVICLKKKK